MIFCKSDPGVHLVPNVAEVGPLGVFFRQNET